MYFINIHLTLISQPNPLGFLYFGDVLVHASLKLRRTQASFCTKYVTGKISETLVKDIVAKRSSKNEAWSG